MKSQILKCVVEKIVEYFRREGLYINYCEIRERRGEFEVFLKLDRNIADLSTVKIVFSKEKEKFFVFTGRVSLDLRLKRLITRILKAEKCEVPLQEENTDSS